MVDLYIMEAVTHKKISYLIIYDMLSQLNCWIKFIIKMWEIYIMTIILTIWIKIFLISIETKEYIIQAEIQIQAVILAKPLLKDQARLLGQMDFD